MEALNQAVGELDLFRIREGKALREDILKHIVSIEDFLGK